MFRFFKKKMRAGMPISTDGFMNGVQWMAEAFERMKVSCGHVEWSEGHIPTIVIDPILLNGTTANVYPFKVDKIVNVTAFYMPAKSIMVNGTDYTVPDGLTTSDVNDWYTLAPFSGSVLNLYIQLSETDGQYGKVAGVEFGTSAPSPYAGEIITIPLVDCTTGFIPLVQGALEIDLCRPDASIRDYNVYRSIAEFSTDNHTLEVEGFRAGTGAVAPFVADDDYTHKFALRETDTVNGTTFMRWYDSLTLLSDIETAVKANIIADDTFLSDLGTEISPYIGWQEGWNSSVTHTGMDFSGSTSAKGTGLSGGNTDHDDSYWHEAGSVTGTPFIDTKSYVTSGEVWAGAFSINGYRSNNFWDLTGLSVSANYVYLKALNGDITLDASGNIVFGVDNGVTLANWTTKGGLTGVTIQEIAIEDAQPSDKILVIRSA